MTKYRKKTPLSGGFGKRLLRLFDCVWPGVCCICAHKAFAGKDLCDNCRSHFPYLDLQAAPTSAASGFMTLCIACGIPQAAGVIRCHKCVKQSSPYAHLAVPFRFAHPVDRLVTGLKYGGQLSYGRVLGNLLADELERTGAPIPDALLPMPMHLSRYRQRGFNQALELASWCGPRLGVRIRSHWATRHVDTPALAALNKASRELEIRGAFQADTAVKGKHIAIVDDVLTTGASSSELARELYDTGAQSVSLWVVARTASADVDQAEFINMRLSEEGSAASSKLP